MSSLSERAKEVFLQAVGLLPGRREAFVAEACGTDARLRQEVESLLAFHEEGASGGVGKAPDTAAPRFAAGDRVRARNINPTGHTRLPRYVRGKIGAIESVHGGFVFPDTNAHGGGEDPQRLYTVVFTARELWGDYADPTLTVSVDAFEPYLEPA